jgi:opacity protein-like surface antigen
MKATVALTLLSAGLSGALAAQRHHGAYVGGGFDAIGGSHGRYGLSLQGGYVRQLNRFGIRLGATYVERDGELPGGAIERLRLVGANAELSYDLTTSRLRPYVIGGLGLYRISWSDTFSGGVLQVDGVSPAVIGGLGFRYRVGKIDLFAEGRVHGFTNKRLYCGCFVTPITFGLRFE